MSRPRTSAADMAILRRKVFERDEWRCAARKLDPEAGPCGNKFGTPLRHERLNERDLTLEHVQEGYGRMGMRAADTEATTVAVCWKHHLGFGDKAGRVWVLANKPLLRQYLDAIYGDVE